MELERKIELIKSFLNDDGIKYFEAYYPNIDLMHVAEHLISEHKYRLPTVHMCRRLVCTSLCHMDFRLTYCRRREYELKARRLKDSHIEHLEKDKLR